MLMEVCVSALGLRKTTRHFYTVLGIILVLPGIK